MKKIASLAAVGLVTFMSSSFVAADGLVTASDGSHVHSSDGSCVIFGGGDPKGCLPKPEAKPAPEVAAPAPAPKPKVVQESFTLSGDALFDTDSSELTTAGQVALDSFLAKVKATEGLDLSKVLVVGHADSRGSDAYNQTLSEDRAATVGTYLDKNGLVSSIIFTEGAGESQPVADNSTSSGRAQNRRVEIAVSGVIYK